MIARVTGLLAEVEDDRVLLDRDGLGYEVLVPGYLAAELADRLNQPLTLYTMEYIEGNPTTGNQVPRLVGFRSTAERAAFQQFLGVKGFGIRKALKAMVVPMGQIAAAVEQGDAISLSKLPGIGRRTAEQIVASLRGKLAEIALVAAAGVQAPASSSESAPLNDSQQVALRILVEWGDRRADAEHYLRRAAEVWPDTEAPEEWVRAAYRIKAGGR